MKAEKEKAGPAPVYVMKMTPALAALLTGRESVSLSLPRVLKAGERVFLREWNGGPTGRADLCTVLGGTNPVQLRRGWAWGSGKVDDDLSALSCLALPDEFPILTPENFCS